MYTTTFLPAGKFYKEVGGNIVMFAAYMYVLSFLLFDKLRIPKSVEVQTKQISTLSLL